MKSIIIAKKLADSVIKRPFASVGVENCCKNSFAENLACVIFDF